MTDDGTTQGSAPGSAATVQPASPAAEEYLDGVRAALADLPAPEVAEILDDVRAHLADLTDELGGEADVAALTARLGSPGAYAAELRAAAGYPAAEPEKAVGSRHGRGRLALVAPGAGAVLFLLGMAAGEIAVVLVGLVIGAVGLPLVIRDGPRVPSVADLPEVRWFAAARPAAGTAARTATDFIGSLQPAWWVLRAVAAAALVVAVFAGGEVPAVLLLGLLAVPVSIWVGHRTRRDRRLLWAVVPLNAVAAIVLLWTLVDGIPGSREPSPASYDVSVPGLWQDGDREIRDIRPVDAEGNPLTGVYLFDQDGLPVDTSGGECAGDDTGSGSNAAYPRGTWDYDAGIEGCRHTPPAPLVVAVPTVPGSGTAPTPVPTPAPTSAPGGAGPTPAPGGTAPEGPAPPVAPQPATPAAPPTG
jgi:hypothetical protein